jgi:glycosyltransferase involved in cell wall biosynthesis
MDAEVTIIIPSLSRLAEPHDNLRMKNAERECLTSILETAEDMPLLFASNGGDCEPLPAITDGLLQDVKRIHIWEQGQCKAVNAAVAATDTEYVMVTNNDMIYPPGWFEEATRYLEVYPFVCATLVEPNAGASTFIKMPFGGAGGDFRKADFLNFVSEYQKLPFPMMTGFNLPFIIKRELWDLVGGYDINYDPWGSNGDSDLEYKLKLAGVQPMQNRNWLVYHFSQTSGTFHASKTAYWQKNFAYFEEKWGFKRTDNGIWDATFKIDYEKLQFRPKWAKIPSGEIV